jgi:hypothetical protein
MPTATSPKRLERAAGGVVNAGRRVPGLRTVLLSRVVARPGHWFATVSGFCWGALLSRFRLRRVGRLLVCSGMPSWSFGRGGTTIGAVYLTRDSMSPGVLAHEDVHRQQWKRYGLAFALLYVAAGADPRSNRFEVEAGLARGGYR